MAALTGTALLAGGLAGATALNAHVQKEGAKDAAKAGRDAAATGAQVQREALESFEERTDPFREAGEQSIPALLQNLGIGGEPAQPFQNPLLQSIQEDVTRRIFANQAARGKLGSGETPIALTGALAPIALQQQQQDFNNLFGLFQSGANVAAGQGQAGLNTAAGVSNSLMQGGMATAQGELGRAQAISGGIGGLTQIAGFGLGGGFGGGIPASQSFTGELGGIGGFRPSIQGGMADGPLRPNGFY